MIFASCTLIHRQIITYIVCNKQPEYDPQLPKFKLSLRPVQTTKSNQNTTLHELLAPVYLDDVLARDSISAFFELIAIQLQSGNCVAVALLFSDLNFFVSSQKQLFSFLCLKSLIWNAEMRKTISYSFFWIYSFPKTAAERRNKLANFNAFRVP